MKSSVKSLSTYFNRHHKFFISLFFYFLLISLMFMDQYSKWYFFQEGILKITIGDLIIFEKVINKGFLLSYFSDVSTNSVNFLLITILGFLFYVVTVLDKILNEHLNSLRFGLIFLISGMLGNILDLIVYSYVRDFINVYKNYYFNIADIFLIIGSFDLIYAIIMNQNKIWFENDIRKGLIIHPKYQLSVGIGLVEVIISIFLIFSGCISFILFKWNFPTKEILILIFSFSLITFMFALLVFYFSIKISLRTAGPIIALKNYVSDPSKRSIGKINLFKLRKNDHFKEELEFIAQQLSNK
jgi:signal peptidase II